MDTKNKIIVGLVILILVVVGGVILSNKYKQKSNISEKKTTISESKAIETIKNKFPELRDYPKDNLPPKSIKTEKDSDGWYVAFVQEGSGMPIINARCFLIKNDTSITQRKYTSQDNTLPGEFSARECKVIENIINKDKL